MMANCLYPNSGNPRLTRKEIITWIYRRYHGLHDDILFKRGVRFLGTSLRTYQDFDTYITHAAFHTLEDLSLPVALGRNGTLPWFASLAAAEKIGRRHQPVNRQVFWEKLMADIPGDLFVRPEYVLARGTVKNVPNGTYQYAFVNMEIQPAATICAGLQPADFTPGPDRIPPADRTALEYWGRLLEAVDGQPTDRAHITRSLWDACRAEPDHPKFNESVLLTGALLDGAPVWLTEFRKGARDALFRMALVAFYNPPDQARTRLAGYVAREFEAFMIELSYQRKDLCLDFIGSIGTEAAVMGHSLFRRVVEGKIKTLRKLKPDAYQALYRSVTGYQYPVFPRAETVTTADMIREGLRRLGRRLLRYANISR